MTKIWSWARYIWERGYPYLLSMIVPIIFYRRGYNFVLSKNMSSAIEGVITATSLIIGFIGTMLPVLATLRKDSVFVKMVFLKDSKKLFLKYLKAMLLSGLFLIVLSIFLFFAREVPGGNMEKYGFYAWVYLVFCFFLTTYRCMGDVLKLVFGEGELSEKQKNKRSPKETQKEVELKAILREHRGKIN